MSKIIRFVHKLITLPTLTCKCKTPQETETLSFEFECFYILFSMLTYIMLLAVLIAIAQL